MSPQDREHRGGDVRPLHRLLAHGTVPWADATLSGVAVAAALGAALLAGAGSSAVIVATGAFFACLSETPGAPSRRIGRMLAATVAVGAASTAAAAAAAASSLALYALVVAVFACALGFTTLRRPRVAQMLTSALMAAIVFAHVGEVVPAWRIGALLTVGGVGAAAITAAWTLLRRVTKVARPPDSLLREREREPDPAWPISRDTVVFATLFTILVVILTVAADLSALSDTWWVPMTFVAILRPQPAVTLRRASEHFAGALIAALPAGLILVALRPSPVVVVVLVLVCVVGARRYLGTHNALGAFFLTLFILAALHLGAQLRPDSAGLRIIAIMIGGTIAVAFAAIWTSGKARARARRALVTARPGGMTG